MCSHVMAASQFDGFPILHFQVDQEEQTTYSKSTASNTSPLISDEGGGEQKTQKEGRTL